MTHRPLRDTLNGRTYRIEEIQDHHRQATAAAALARRRSPPLLRPAPPARASPSRSRASPSRRQRSPPPRRSSPPGTRPTPTSRSSRAQGSWDNVHDQLVTQFAGGTAPDIIHDESADIVGFAEQGYLADLTPYLSEEVKADVSEDIWQPSPPPTGRSSPRRR